MFRTSPEVCEVCAAVLDHLRSSHAVMGTRPGLGPGRWSWWKWCLEVRIFGGQGIEKRGYHPWKKWGKYGGNMVKIWRTYGENMVKIWVSTDYWGAMFEAKPLEISSNYHPSKHVGIYEEYYSYNHTTWHYWNISPEMTWPLRGMVNFWSIAWQSKVTKVTLGD